MRILNYLKNNPNIRDSLLLHLVVLLIFSFGVGFSINKSATLSAPIIVDLSEIKIAEKTNLPVKTVKKKKEEPKQKKQHAKPKPIKKPEPKPVVPKPKTEPKKASDTALVAKKKTETKPKEKAKTEPKPKTEPAKKANDLSSLLASVEKLEKENPKPQASAVDKLTEGLVAKGTTNNAKGNPDLALTIGQKDAIASKLRECWNIDAGAKGVLDMTVGIKTKLDRDGKVADVEIEDNSRYSSDKIFRAIADSARRAVYVCDKKGDESPFKILSKYYPNEYNMWKELYLQFNPLDGGIF